MQFNRLIILFISLMISYIALNIGKSSKSRIKQNSKTIQNSRIITGAERTYQYFPLLTNKRIGIVGNHSTMIGNTHLVDSLVNAGFNVKAIFCPEHGFRGTEDAGATIVNDIDSKTGIPIISLYGNNKKPKAEQLQDIDIMIFDIQDVGVRFYTYISTLHYVLESCAENNIEVVVLDRPNPNGFYVDGPVLNIKYKSFVGMHPVPIVHGMTIGEYSCMINEEGWLKDSIQCYITVVNCLNYTHDSLYILPINPSPNLKSMEAIYLYPSTCLFEGTVMSVGRGTDKPFQIFGHPDYLLKDFSFMPIDRAGARKPLYENTICYGKDITYLAKSIINKENKILLEPIIQAYKNMPDQLNFFSPFFNKLVGTSQLKYQIIMDLNEEDIKKTWHADLNQFKKIRKKYLHYPDFTEK